MSYETIKQDLAILVGFSTELNTQDIMESLNELERLAQTVSIKTLHKLPQQGHSASARTLIGSGKVNEIKRLIAVDHVDMVIFDDALTPAQLRNLEQDLDIQVFDRSFLILSIFAERAHSKESTLEVALAQKQYMISRLIGMRASLSRQGGGSYNAKGPGETKLELDRRKILGDITQIKKQLQKIKTEKQTSRKLRQYNQMKTVALVGYTNAGKSSMMNALLKRYSHLEHETLEKDMLFSTIDTKAKKITYKDHRPYLLIDTVGFISKLPTELVTSFETTLEDVLQADLILHLIDGTTMSDVQVKTTEDVLESLGAKDIPRLYVVTKSDLCESWPLFDKPYIYTSSKTGDGLEELMEAINDALYETYRTFVFNIPFNNMDVYNKLKTRYFVLNEVYDELGVQVKVFMDPLHLNPYLKYKKED